MNTISFDLVDNPIPKVYFYPIAKAISLNVHGGELVAASLESLDLNIASALDAIREYVSKAKTRRGHSVLRFECLSFDAVSPEYSRLKLHIRTPHTSFEVVREIFTLGGRLSGDKIDS